MLGSRRHPFSTILDVAQPQVGVNPSTRRRRISDVGVIVHAEKDVVFAVIYMGGT